MPIFFKVKTVLNLKLILKFNIVWYSLPFLLLDAKPIEKEDKAPVEAEAVEAKEDDADDDTDAASK